MKTRLTLILLLSSLLMGWAQEQRSPNIQVNNLNKSETPVRISDVKVDVKVVGALAVTTIDMTFYNPNNRILEGELQFPLADGQSISRFALDINGKLREGVVVEKAKGQAVFESTIRRKVDPGLLEKTQGNNFRTRVYPLPSKGTRHIVIAYEQELARCDNGDYQFFLPVEFRDVLDNFSLNVAVHGDGQKPVVDKTPWGSFSFDKSGEAYIASYSAKNYPAKGQLVFSIPVKSNKQVYIEKGQISGDPVFYAQVFPTLKEEAKQAPKSIALFWDASSSMANRNLKLEMELLDNYFRENKNLSVNLYTFNCILGKPQIITITNGSWSKLKEVLENTSYDGATQMGSLDFSKLKVDEILLFTDGLSNFGKLQPVMGKLPVTVITSSLNANHSLLKYISTTSGGTYINLMNQTPAEAAKWMKNESFRLISADYDKSAISELTTSGTVVNPKAGFTMAGKLMKPRATVTLSFGIGSRVLYTETLTIDQKNAADCGNIIERIWAEKKIAELDLLFDKNKDEIESLGRTYNIVTRNTSLIVLDNVEDYIAHKITPPAELLDEYNRRVNAQQSDIIENKQDRIENIVSMLEDRKEWWNRNFKKEREEARKQEMKNRRTSATLSTSSGAPSMVARQTNTYNGQNVSGVIKDETGEPIIGVAVSIKGTNRGAVSDVDGKYTINAGLNDILQFNYIGFNSIEVPIRGSVLDVILTETRSVLEEVVVTGYGSQRHWTITGAVSSVDVDELRMRPSPPPPPASSPVSIESISSYSVQGDAETEEILPPSIDAQLQGRVAGIQVQESKFEAPANADIRVRGASSTSGTSDVMYVVDGEVVSDFSTVDPNSIESMDVLKDASATGIYGARAANGVVVITTKNASAEAKQKSEKLTEAITLHEWSSNEPYMDKLKSKPDKDLYAAYLAIKEEYKSTPSFYLEVATLFEERGLTEQALIILSNLAEMGIEDYRLIRVLGHRLQQMGYNDYAIDQFKQLLTLRPEEPQTYRDLGLVYTQNKEYQKAIDILRTILEREWDGRFSEIELFAVEEINNAIGKANRESVKLDLSEIDKRLIYSMPVNIRIVLNWDTDNSDMDLWVTDPLEEKCYYGNKDTEIGGIISHDFTGGYGPEEFMIKDAVKGKYKIQANYYGSREQTLIGPTTVYLDIYTNYSTSREKKKTITLRLTENKEVIDIGEISFE